jgi:hypothetical protein
MQDAGGHTDCAAWVIDGATPMWKVSWTDHADDTQWLVQNLSHHFANYIDDPANTIAGAIKLALGDFVPDKFYDQPIARHKHPMFTIAVIRHLPEQLPEYYILCDSEILLHQSDGKVKNLTDPGFERIVSQHKRAKYKNSQDYRSHTKTIIARNNSATGYWVGSPDGKGIDHGLTGTVDSGGIETIILTTDGLTRLIHEYDMMVPAQMFDHSFKRLLSKLRKYENDMKGHIFKNSDDVFAYRLDLS